MTFSVFLFLPQWMQVRRIFEAAVARSEVGELCRRKGTFHPSYCTFEVDIVLLLPLLAII